MRLNVLTSLKSRLRTGGGEMGAASPMTEVLAGLGCENSITVLHVDIRLGFKYPLTSLCVAGYFEMNSDNMFPHCPCTRSKFATFNLCCRVLRICVSV